MHKSKKTPMYESTTTPNQVKNYDFVDFTTPTSQSVPQTSPPSQNNKENSLIRKIETIYKSQLLNIEQSKQQDAHVDDQTKQNSQNQERVFGEITNNNQPFSRILRLDTYQTLGTQQPLDDQVFTQQTGNSFHSHYSFNNTNFNIRRSKTIIQEESNNNYSQPSLRPYYFQRETQATYPSYSNYSQKYTSSSYNLPYSSSSTHISYFSIMADYTSDELIQLMPDPYRSSLQNLKYRVKSKSQSIL